MNTSQKNTASLKTLLAQLIRIERELDRIISEETDAYPDMSSAFFTELRELLYLRKKISPAAITLILSLRLSSKDDYFP